MTPVPGKRVFPLENSSEKSDQGIEKRNENKKHRYKNLGLHGD